MNKVILLGRLTGDPDTRYTADKTAVTHFNIAVDRRYKQDGEQAADFPRVVAFGKTAEFIDKYFVKGTKIAIEGRLQTGSYTNKDGQTVYTTEVVAENVEFAERKRANDAPPPSDDFVSIPADDGVDLPFK